MSPNAYTMQGTTRSIKQSLNLEASLRLKNKRNEFLGCRVVIIQGFLGFQASQVSLLENQAPNL